MSYLSDLFTQNVVPDHFPEVLVTIDSISIVCETTDPSRTTSPVPISCIEVGENHKLPGASLRLSCFSFIEMQWVIANSLV